MKNYNKYKEELQLNIKGKYLFSKKLCIESLKLSHEIYDYIDNVNYLGEESITDYLIWEIRKNKVFKSNFVKTKTFTKHKENKVYGADLILWIKKDRKYLPLLIQAKKFLVHNCDGYCKKLNYKSKTASKKQIDTLLKYAADHNKEAYYLFYSFPNNDTETKFCNTYVHTKKKHNSLYLVDARKIKDIANDCENLSGTNKSVHLNDILYQGHFFASIFCCNDLFELNKDKVVDVIPAYVKYIENDTLDKITKVMMTEYDLNDIRIIGLIDLSDKESS